VNPWERVRDPSP